MTISMGSGSTSGNNFTVPIQVTGINDFFGATFLIAFDPTSASYVSFSSTGSVIDDGGATVIIYAAPSAPGELQVTATRQQEPGGTYVPGVNIGVTSTLITLNFRATAAVTSNSFTFTNREIQTCNDATQTCTPVPDASLTWSGGSMRAN